MAPYVVIRQKWDASTAENNKEHGKPNPATAVLTPHSHRLPEIIMMMKSF